MSDAARGIDPKLLEILVCPKSKDRLVWDAAAQELISVRARLGFPVRDGVPIMLIDEARELSDEEIARLASGLTQS
jgi:uncharacterized protein YbaR (Trm112 family)